MKNIAINGFGRIGRIFLRIAMKDQQFNNMINVTAINDLADLHTLAHLFKYDTIYGRYEGNVITDIKDNLLIVDNHKIKNIIRKRSSKPTLGYFKNRCCFGILWKI